MASPAEVLRQALSDAGALVLPALAGQTVDYEQGPGATLPLAYVDSLPETPDLAMLLKDNDGLTVSAGRLQTGKMLFHHGVLLTVRTPDQGEDFGDSYDKVQGLANAVNAVGRGTVTVRGVPYLVEKAYRVGRIKRGGEEVGRRRLLFMIGARLVFQEAQPQIG